MDSGLATEEVTTFRVPMLTSPHHRRASLLCLTLLAACSPIYVDSEYDQQADFARLKTFRWIDAPPLSVGDPRVDDRVLQARVQVAVNRELEAKGMRRVERGDADVLLDYHVAVDEKMTGQNLHDKYGYTAGSGWAPGARQGWSWGLGGYEAPSAPVTYYEEGSIVIDMVEPTTRRLLWRGSARAVVTLDDDDESRRQRLNEAIARIFKHYPPK